ncbi:MAG: CotH kinase family protein [Planctomycetia bacterium]|nr:CotH kinase family protein [Planctomycetia bacterium]MCC7316216.1 CotH kinase family protein [Planctomycetota bacterium]
MPAGGAQVAKDARHLIPHRRWLPRFLAALVTAALCSTSFANVVITELMYHPLNDNEAQEFLEIQNTGASAVSLTGWCVEGIDYCFTAGTTIAPGDYMLLAKDAAQFQTAYGFPPDFVYTGQLSNSGERIAIKNASAVVQDEVEYSDVGFWPTKADGQGPSLERIDPLLNGNTPRNWRACIAGPGHTANAVNSVNAVGLPPWISEITHTADPSAMATITVTARIEDATTNSFYYKIGFTAEVAGVMFDDGAHGDGAAGDGVFGAEIPGQPVSTLIRYRITASGPTGQMSYPRTDDTITYAGLMVQDPGLVTDLPVFHWFMDPAAYAAAIAHKLTDQLEPAVFAYDGVVYDGVMVRVRGQTSRQWPKNHWKFYMPQGHDFFAPGLFALPVDQFNLQCNYSDKAYVREILAYESFRDSGNPSNQVFHVRLQQNGQFFGLYNFLESMDEDYIARNKLDTNAAWYKADDDCRFRSLAQLPNEYQKEQRLTEDYSDLFALLDGINNLTGQAKTDFIFDNVNIPAMLNFLAAQCIVHNNDHVAKNYYLYRDTEGTGRWTCQTWDMDLTFGRNFGAGGGVLSDGIWADDDAPHPSNTLVSPSHPLFGDTNHRKWDDLWNRLINVVHADLNIRAMYHRRLRTLADELLQAGRYEDRIDELVSHIGPEAVLDVAKWGQYGQSQSLATAVNILKNDYLAVRRIHLLTNHRVPGEIPEAQSFHPKIVINELMYNPAVSGDHEFIELYNPSPTEAVDLSGWRLDGVALVIPPGSVILPNGYMLVVRGDVQFRTQYGSGKFVAAQYSGNLDGGGETLTLRHKDGTVIDTVTYDDATPWPTSPDGGGYSLELIDASQDNDRVGNWAASASPGGTPGLPNSMAGFTPTVPPIFINEALPDNESKNRDEAGQFDPWVELYNAGEATVEIGGMYLTNTYGNPTLWQIPPETQICGGEHLLIWTDGSVGEGPLHANFTIGLTTGSVGLYSSTGHIIDYLNYANVPSNISFGRLPDGGHQLLQFAIVTPVAPNDGDATPIILNEYNAVRPTGLLKDNGSDTFWGRVLANGGDWFEMVITRDHTDIRGWQLVVSDNTGIGTPLTLTLTNDPIWSDLRRGTLITVSEDLPDDVSYSPASGDWWINVRAANAGTGTYITAADFEVSHTNWQLTIKDEVGVTMFGPAGEGIEPVSGIGNDEVFKLEQDPGAFIHPKSDYNDGTSSTFGSPNIYSAGTVTQDFTVLRGSFMPCMLPAECDDGNPCTIDDCVDGECVNTPMSPCDQLSLNWPEATGPEIKACPGSQIVLTLDVSGLHAPINGVQAILNYDTSLLSLVSMTPGDGGASPWNSAAEVFEDDTDGLIKYAVILLATSSQADATVATLTFDVLAPGGNINPSRVAFSTTCLPVRNKLTTFDNQTISPVTIDSDPITIGPRIDVALQIQGLGFEVTRDVTFTITNCTQVLQVITTPVTFGPGGLAELVLTNVDPTAEWIAAVEGHTLQSRLPIAFTTCFASAHFVASDQLISGDLRTSGVPQDNLIDILDYAILAARWNTMVTDCPIGLPADCGFGADVNGDGQQGTIDFTALQINFFLAGDSAADCPPPTPPPSTGPKGGTPIADAGVASEPIRPRGPSAVRTGKRSLSVAEAVRLNPRLGVADQDSDGMIDAKDVRAFAEKHGIVMPREAWDRLSDADQGVGSPAVENSAR